MRKKWSNENGWPEIVPNMRHRIGINSGEMVTGNMGSSMRMNYTMMGDTVKLAARLEPAAKHYGVYLFVAENTYNKVSDSFEWRYLDKIKVKGKNKPVKVYELLSEKNKLNKENSNLITAFNEAMSLYKDQSWIKAKKIFKESEKLEEIIEDRPTNPSKIYIERCNYFQKNSPGKDWDGIWTMKTK